MISIVTIRRKKIAATTIPMIFQVRPDPPVSEELVDDVVNEDEGFRVTITFQRVFLQALLEAALRRWRETPTRTGSCTEASVM